MAAVLLVSFQDMIDAVVAVFGEAGSVVVCNDVEVTPERSAGSEGSRDD